MKLWFFRTPGGRYMLSSFKIEKDDMDIYAYSGSAGVMTLSRKPSGFPPLAPGECVPVELVVKPKKARKG